MAIRQKDHTNSKRPKPVTLTPSIVHRWKLGGASGWHVWRGTPVQNAVHLGFPRTWYKSPDTKPKKTG